MLISDLPELPHLFELHPLLDGHPSLALPLCTLDLEDGGQALLEDHEREWVSHNVDEGHDGTGELKELEDVPLNVVILFLHEL